MTLRLGRRLFGIASLATLAGCGFQPVYMRTASGKPGPAQRELETVFVRIIPDRPGQLLRQALQERFGSDDGTPAAYDLAVTFAVFGEGIGITTNDLATRIRLTGTATYTLTSHDGKNTPLTTGSARAVDGVNIFDSQYFAADLETEAKQQDLAEKCADQITNQLATWFHSRAQKQAQAG